MGGKWIYLIYAICLWFGIVWARANPVVSIQFRDSVSVSEKRFTLRDIADVQGPETITQKLLRTPVGRSANFGHSRKVDVYHIYRRHLLPLTQGYDLQGDFEKVIIVASEANVLHRDSLVAIVEEWLQKAKPKTSGDFEFEFTTIPHLVRVPVGMYALNIETPPRFHWRGRQNIILQIKEGKEVLRRLPLGIYLRELDSVLVAGHRIRRGDPVKESDFYLAYRDVTRISGVPLKDPAALIQKKARQTITADRILTSRLVEQEPVIQLGDPVTVTMEREGLSVTFESIARQSGVMGEVILVKSLASHKLVRVRVLEENKAEWIASVNRG